MKLRSEIFFPEKSDSFISREINPEKIVDYLQQLGSHAQIIPLAEVMRTNRGKLRFTHDEGIAALWKQGMVSIRQSISADLIILAERLGELNFLSATFMAELEQEIHRIINLSLARLARLQETVGQKWSEVSPPNSFFPALEQFFRNGELLRFQNKLRVLQKVILKDYRKKVRGWKKNPEEKETKGEIQLNFEQTVQILEDALNFLVSFYDQKWSLLLSPSF